MKRPLKTASLSSFIWIILLIVILVCFIFVQLSQDSKSEIVENNISALNHQDLNYHKLDSCISVLYEAENNSRLFVITLDSSYINTYRQQLNYVSRSLTEFEVAQGVQRKSLSGLLGDKKLKDRQFVEMRILVDSLLEFSLKMRQSNKVIPKATVSPTITRRKEVAQTDTVHEETEKQKRKLFKRIADAIANKEQIENTVTHSERSVTIKDSMILVERRKEVDEGFDQYHTARRQLNATEQEMLLLNGRIFANLKNILRQRKGQEEANVKAARSSLVASTRTQFDQVQKLSSGSILIVLALTMMIVWNLIRLYRQEVELLQYASHTAEITRKKGEFMSHMAHEIRTPLNSVIGFAQLIDADNLDDQLKGNVTAIKNSSKTLLTLVNEILDFSKFERGEIKLKNLPFQPGVIIPEAEEMLSVLAAEKNIDLRTDYDIDSKLSVFGDDFWIKQVVINLLTNAIKFTPSKGWVSLESGFERTTQEKGILRIEVKDSGIGIAPENMGKIFEDFIQVEGEEVVATQVGTGLGLAICKRIVDLYGGQISVESVVGKGSTFRVHIPLVISAEPMDQEDPISAEPRLFLKNKKVLIADDTRMNLILTSKIMDKHAVKYDLAKNGREAFQLFEAGRYDLIITDIQMPIVDGVQLTGLIRKFSEKAKSRIPILAFTGSSTEESRKHYIASGMNDVLDKPFDEKHFLDVIERLIRSGQVVSG